MYLKAKGKKNVPTQMPKQNLRQLEQSTFSKQKYQHELEVENHCEIATTFVDAKCAQEQKLMYITQSWR